MIKPISEKRALQIIADLPIRQQLAERCGGVYIVTGYHRVKTHSGEVLMVPCGYCAGGHCEYCGKWGLALHPHEENPRGRGGKLSVENSRMCCAFCHPVKHHEKVAADD